MLLHTFENGFCTTCGTNLDYEVERLRERSTIGPLLRVDDNQFTFPLTMSIYI